MVDAGGQSNRYSVPSPTGEVLKHEGYCAAHAKRSEAHGDRRTLAAEPGLCSLDAGDVAQTVRLPNCLLLGACRLERAELRRQVEHAVRTRYQERLTRRTCRLLEGLVSLIGMAEQRVARRDAKMFRCGQWWPGTPASLHAQQLAIAIVMARPCRVK